MRQLREQEQAFAGVLCLTAQRLIMNKGETEKRCIKSWHVAQSCFQIVKITTKCTYLRIFLCQYCLTKGHSSGLTKRVREQEQAFPRVLHLAAQTLVQNRGEIPQKFCVNRYDVIQVCYQTGNIYSKMYVPTYISESVSVFMGKRPLERGNLVEHRFPVAIMAMRLTEVIRQTARVQSYLHSKDRI